MKVEKKYIRNVLLGCLILITCTMSVSYYRMIKNIESLKLKLEEFGDIMNASNDRLRLVFAKHQDAFYEISQYIVEKYDKAFFIEFKDNKIYVDYKIVDDGKIYNFFLMVINELILPHGSLENQKMSVVYSKNEYLGGYEMIFELYANKTVNWGSYGFIKYEKPNEFMLNKNIRLITNLNIVTS